jgi:hypothetical protein
MSIERRIQKLEAHLSTKDDRFINCVVMRVGESPREAIARVKRERGMPASTPVSHRF